MSESETMREAAARMWEDSDKRWHAVAELLTFEADYIENYGASDGTTTNTLTVARAYLGESE